MRDVRRDYENYKKRGTRVSVSNPSTTYNDNELIVFTLPENVYITKVFVDVIKADTTAGATLDVVAVKHTPKPKFADFTASTDVLADEITIDSTGLKVCSTCAIKKFDGKYTVATRNGNTAGAGDGYFAVVVEYVEYTNTSEELTDIPMYPTEAITA